MFKNIVFVLFFLFPSLSYSKALILLPLEDGLFKMDSEIFSDSTVRIFRIANKVNELMNIDSYPDYVDLPYSKYLTVSQYLAKDSFSVGTSYLVKNSSTTSIDLAYYTLRYPDSFVRIQELSQNGLNYLMDDKNTYEIRGQYHALIYHTLSSSSDISVILYTMLKDPSVLNEYWKKELEAGNIKTLPTVISLYDPKLDAFSLNFADNFFDTSSRIVGLTSKLIDDLNRLKLDAEEKTHSFVFASDFNSPIAQSIYKIFQSKRRSGVYNIDFSFVETNKDRNKKSLYKYYFLDMDGTYYRVSVNDLACTSWFSGG